MNFSLNRLLAWLGVALVFFLVLWLLAPVLTPFVIAIVLAYVMHPLVHKLCRMRVPKGLAVLLVELLGLLVLLGLFVLVLTVVMREGPLLREQLPTLLDRADAWVQPWLKYLGINVSIDLPAIKSQLALWFSDNKDDLASPMLAYIMAGSSAIVTLLGYAVLLPVTLFFTLYDWEKLVARALELVPPRWRTAFDGFVHECDSVLGEYLRGQVAVMLALAVAYTCGLALFHLDLALPIGVFTGLAVFVPYLGFGLGLVLALVAGLLQFDQPSQAFLMVAVVYGLGQVLESFVLTPRLIGERIGLHPLAVILALMAFGQLLGFVGVLIALPASAVLFVALKRLRQTYLESPMYRYSSDERTRIHLGQDPTL